LTELLYQTDSYLQSFEAVVCGVDADSHGVILDRSAFYPGGGGQPCDLGTLILGGHSAPVLRARKIGPDVLHLLPPETTLPPVGTQARGQIDWERRHQLMRTHTALHILCGVVFREHGALVTGGDMDPLQGRMDFEFETMQKELVQSIEAAVNREVAAARPVAVKILPRAAAFQIPDLIRTKINLLPEGIEFVRVVELVGLDLQADGGTHVSNTSEVGQIRVTDYKSKGKINKRIYIEIG
jgi:misacylated tRNA(Ala) deacylase